VSLARACSSGGDRLHSYVGRTRIQDGVINFWVYKGSTNAEVSLIVTLIGCFKYEALVDIEYAVYYITFVTFRDDALWAVFLLKTSFPYS
jgi:hypothetical protein